MWQCQNVRQSHFPTYSFGSFAKTYNYGRLDNLYFPSYYFCVHIHVCSRKRIGHLVVMDKELVGIGQINTITAAYKSPNQ